MKNLFVVVVVVAMSGCQCAAQQLDLTPSPAEIAPPEVVYTKPKFSVGLAINNATTETIYRGWPVVVRLFGGWMSSDNAGSVTFSGPLSLNLRKADGTQVELAWKLNRPPREPSTLSADTPMLNAAWTLSSQESQFIESGDYTITASWGDFETNRQTLRCADAPLPLDRGARLSRTKIELDVATLRGEATQSLVDSELGEFPDDVELLRLKALEFEERGDIKGALSLVNRGIGILMAESGRGEPPVSPLFAMQRRLDRKAMAIIKDGGHL